MSIRPHGVSRRDFLKRTGGALAALPFGLRALPASSDIPVATQMWVVRKEAAVDLRGVLRSLSEIGYQGVEFADDYFGHSIPDVRRMLDESRLRVAGNHLFFESLLGDRLAATVEQQKALGATNLIVRSLKPEQYATREAVVRLAGQLNEIAARLAPHGMRVGFHNHSEIFRDVGGEMAWNVLADHTRREVILQLDTGNAMHSPDPVDLAQLLRRNPGRTVTTHIKPFSRAEPGAYLGRDELDWKTILKLMETTGGTEWYIIEYEVPGPRPLDALRENLALFRGLRAAL